MAQVLAAQVSANQGDDPGGDGRSRGLAADESRDRSFAAA
jgi:hypothetical protein